MLLYVNQGVGSDNIQLTHEVFYFTYWGHLYWYFSEFQQDWNYKYKKVMLINGVLKYMLETVEATNMQASANCVGLD